MPRAATTSDVFNAIAEPRRRAIMVLLLRGERSVGDVARELSIGQPSASKHLAVLKDVDLVSARRVGRQVRYRAQAAALRPVHDWASIFEDYWKDQLDDIKRIAENREAEAPEPRPENTSTSKGDRP